MISELDKSHDSEKAAIGFVAYCLALMSGRSEIRHNLVLLLLSLWGLLLYLEAYYLFKLAIFLGMALSLLQGAYRKNGFAISFTYWFGCGAIWAVTYAIDGIHSGAILIFLALAALSGFRLSQAVHSSSSATVESSQSDSPSA